MRKTIRHSSSTPLSTIIQSLPLRYQVLLPFYSNVEMLRYYQLLGACFLVLSLPLFSFIFSVLLLLIKTILIFTCWNNNSSISRIVSNLGVTVFLSATSLTSASIAFWMVKRILCWIVERIDSFNPIFSINILSIQLCGMAVIILGWIKFKVFPLMLHYFFGVIC